MGHWNGTASGSTSGRLFSGNLAHVALYTNALSADEVLTHFNLGRYGTATLAPVLSVARGAQGSVVVSWPASTPTSFGLQESAAVTGTWSAVNATPQIVNSKYEVTVAPGASRAFYRLKLQ